VHTAGFARRWIACVISVVWDELTGQDVYVYHSNQSGGWGWHEPVAVGDDWTFDVRLTTPDAEHALSETLRIVGRQWSGRSYDCYTFDEWEPGFSITSCLLLSSFFDERNGIRS
jgi:hypothetical protein